MGTKGKQISERDPGLTQKTEEMKYIIKANIRHLKQEPVRTVDECIDRLDDFFMELARRGELPTVEKMALALGTTRQTLWQWENGAKGEEWARVILRAKDILAAIDAELVNRWKIPQVVYMFRAKNYFGMKDQQDVVVRPASPFGEHSIEDVQARLVGEE